MFNLLLELLSLFYPLIYLYLTSVLSAMEEGHVTGQLWNLYILQTKLKEHNLVSDGQAALCVGEIVSLRLGSSELVESQVIHVHEGEEERVDVQLQTPEANVKFPIFKCVSRRKLARPRLRFYDD